MTALRPNSSASACRDAVGCDSESLILHAIPPDEGEDDAAGNNTNEAVDGDGDGDGAATTMPGPVLRLGAGGSAQAGGGVRG